MKALIVGRGRVGSMLLRALRSAGVAVRAQSSRVRIDAHGYDLVILAVRDPALSSVSERVAQTVTKKTVVLHCAGGQGALVLNACAKAGASTGVMHPLVSVADRKRSPSLELTTFVIAGDARARRVASSVAVRVGATPLVANVHGPLYHAAAVMLVGGTLSTLLDSVQIAVSAGVPAQAATRAMVGLMMSVVENVVVRGAAASLTGPIVRADVDTVKAHLRALGRDKASANAYRAMSERMIHVAEHAGLSKKDAAALTRALATKKKVSR